jgi:Ca2+-binding RTX toxin-like protein
MATYDLDQNTYTLEQGEEDFTLPALPPGGAGGNVIGNELDNHIIGNTGQNTLTGGRGGDVLEGGGGNDSLIGGLGSDILNGGAGADTLEGGDDGDVYIVDDAGDVVVEMNGGEGIDKVEASVDFILGNFVEDLVLVGDENAHLSGTGNALENSITGNRGSNTLDGGEGADHLIGGLGDDTYVIDNENDTITEEVGEGIDTVISYRTFTLVDTALEHLELIGDDEINGTGNDENNIITGNGAKNHLIGGGGNDQLNGGAGADKLVGGNGNDAYWVDETGDIVEEYGQEGEDTVHAFISYILTDNIENLVLDGTAHSSGTGNALVNNLLGNDGNNVLDGKGGADVLTGGKGNDTYVIDTADTINEFEDEGTDTIEITDVYEPLQNTFTYTLGAVFENLTLRGSRNINGTGNENHNLIIGNAGVNVLNGGNGNDTLDGGNGADRLEGGSGKDLLIGGAGADMMIGGEGDDDYFIDSAEDVVSEVAAGGSLDRIISKINYTLGANVEYLALENGFGDLTGTGNSLDNTMFGNDGNNVIDGGAGRDQLWGRQATTPFMVGRVMTPSKNLLTAMTFSTATQVTTISAQKVEMIR